MEKIRARLAKRADDMAKLTKATIPEGTYVNEALGTLIVSKSGVKFGDREGPLLASGDQLLVKWFDDDSPEKIAFRNDAIIWLDRSFTRVTNNDQR